MIAAPSSGCGKTTFTLGLLRALRDRGLSVQPFKSGPDYIDPLFHQMAAGVESVNLDTYMSSPAHVQALFGHYGGDADASVVEAAMGLFDGADGPRGSAAEVAEVLDVPVVLLVSAKAVAYSVAPLIYGFRHFNPRLRLAGVVFNFVASDRQLATLRRACEDAGVPCLGFLPRNSELVVPSRHLGLTLQECEKTERLIALAAQEVTKHIDLDRLLEGTYRTDRAYELNKTLSPLSRKGESLAVLDSCAQPLPSLTGSEGINGLTECQAALSDRSRTPLLRTGQVVGGSIAIAVARDAAFNFTYRANIDALRRLCEVFFFSPLQDADLPQCDLLYLPGGYPELFAEQLAGNMAMREQIRAYAEAGGRVLAECGGFMYLCRDIDGQPMCGILPYSATMQGARLHLGYRETVLNGIMLRGHEFHYSTTIPEAPTPFIHYKNIRAGYPHWYWADDPQKLLSLLAS